MRATRVAAGIAVSLAMLPACSGDGSSAGSSAPPTTTVPPATTVPADHPADHGTIDPADRRAVAQLATAGYQDVETAEAAGYASSLDTLGCFQDTERGGMGLHYVDADLMDDTVDITSPEALVYELDADGEITGLVAHEYIVPIDAWTAAEPPSLFGMGFHQHPTLPLWVLHAWLWKDNPTGVFEDWNPAVRLCPDEVPIFGVDLPAPPAPAAPPAPSETPTRGR